MPVTLFQSLRKHETIADKRALATLAILVFLSFTVKFFLTIIVPVINKDGALYLIAAKFVSQGNFEKARQFFPYLPYPFMIAFLSKLIPDPILVGHLLSIIPGAFSIIPFYLVGREIFGTSAALWSCIAFVFCPLLNEVCTWIVRDPLWLFCVLWSFYFYIRYLAMLSPAKWIAGTVLLICSAFIRVESIVLLPVGLFLGLWGVWKSNTRKILTLLLLVAILGIGVLLVQIFPFVIPLLRLHELIGYVRDIVDLKFLDNYRVIYDALKQLQARLPASAWPQNFAELARHYIILIYMVGLLEILIKTTFFPFFIVALYGLTAAVRNGDRYVTSLFLFALFALIPGFWSLLVRNFVSVRYVTLPSLLFILFFGLGWNKMLKHFAKWAEVRIGGTLTAKTLQTIVSVAIMIVIPLSYAVSRQLKQRDDVILKASDWLGNNLSLCKYVSNDPRIALYSNNVENFTFWSDPNDIKGVFAFAELSESDLVKNLSREKT